MAAGEAWAFYRMIGVAMTLPGDPMDEAMHTGAVDFEGQAQDEERLARAQAAALLAWYEDHRQDRMLPWRDPAEPWDRVVMVEGLLAQTTASTVAAHYRWVFAGVRRGADWIALDAQERWDRVAPLGYPTLKRWAMDSLADLLMQSMVDVGQDCSWTALQERKGIGPYTAGMVATLHGQDAAPVDVNVARVGARCDQDGDADRWIARIVAAANRAPHVRREAPGYEVVCAVLDIGARICRPRRLECGRCPLWAAECASAGRPGEQLVIGVCG